MNSFTANPGSNLLDPRFRARNLRASEKQTGLEFLQKQLEVRFPGSAAQAELLKFIGNDLPFPLPEGGSPSDWWRAALSLGFFGAELTSFASSLLESCATTSGLERFFSTCKWFQGALRNSLGVEKVKMLCVCNRELRPQDMEDEDGW